LCRRDATGVDSRESRESSESVVERSLEN
jgi:hypothetical protein